MSSVVQCRVIRGWKWRKLSCSRALKGWNEQCGTVQGYKRMEMEEIDVEKKKRKEKNRTERKGQVREWKC